MYFTFPTSNAESEIPTVDLKDQNYSAIHDLPKIGESQYVYKRVLQDNHRHEAIDEVFEMLNGM